MQFAMVVYFPRGQQTFSAIKVKLEDDRAGARRNSAEVIAFVTNQELTLTVPVPKFLALPIQLT